MNKDLKHRLIITYSRISTYHQKHDLETQKVELKQFSLDKGYNLDYEFSEVGSGLTFNHRSQFFKMLDLITSGKVDVAFNMFEHLFNNFNTKIEIVDDKLNPKTDKN